MKKILLQFIGGTPTIAKVGVGVWKVTTSDTLTTRLVVLNQTPNQNMEDWGGYNAIDTEADTYSFPTGYSISVKQYLARAAEFGETPPRGCMRNYRTLEECADAIENGTDVQGIVLADA